MFAGIDKLEWLMTEAHPTEHPKIETILTLTARVPTLYVIIWRLQTADNDV